MRAKGPTLWVADSGGASERQDGDPPDRRDGSARGPPRLNPPLFWPSFHCCHQRPALGSVESLANDVGMPSMTRSLLDKVKQDPPNGAALGIGKPRSLRKRNAAT
jgi:hypothetical protein